MLVRDWMSTNVIDVNTDDTIVRAMDLLADNHISMMPVMEEGKLVGVITDRDIKRASPSDASPLDFQKLFSHLARLEVGAIMNRYPITVPIDSTITEAAQVLLDNHISGCPVVDDHGAVKGIVTKSDLFKVMISMSGHPQRGLQIGLRVADQPGSIKEITDIIRTYGARIASILSSYEKAPEGFRHVYFRTFDVNRETEIQLLDELKSVAEVLYAVDHREGTREIFPRE
jgi:acetoin utilization protein AcuB